MLGIESLHWAPDDLQSRIERQKIAQTITEAIRHALRHVEEPLGRWNGYDAFSDIGPITQNFEEFDRWYPGSLFIYTDRDEDAWVRSRKHHVVRNIEKQRKGEYVGRFTEVDEPRWRADRRAHRERVMEYFRNRGDEFLVLRVCDGEGMDKLGPFLDIPEDTISFPHRDRV